MIFIHILRIIFLNDPKAIFLHTVEWFHVFLSYTNNSIYFKQFYFNQFSLVCQQSQIVPSIAMYH